LGARTSADCGCGRREPALSPFRNRREHWLECAPAGGQSIADSDRRPRVDESLDNADLIREKYQGIRPAPGYPACPDHTEKRTLFDLLRAESNAGITLTESFAMLPAASVSGYYFWRPEAQYFGVGKIERDQVEEYARRKGLDVPEVERWLAPNLNYER